MPPMRSLLPPPSSSLLQATSLTRPTTTPTSPLTTQIRHATLLRRPHRPYTFTQLLTLSDGSTFTHRTTSPLPVYKSTKDTRNTPLWNPSNAKLANVEEDEAGRLRAFRKRFGRGWDAEGAREDEAGAGLGLQQPEQMETGMAGGEAEGEGEGEIVGVRVPAGARAAKEGESEEVGVGRRKGRDGEVASASEWSDEGEENLLDLISSFSTEGPSQEVETPKASKKGGKGRK